MARQKLKRFAELPLLGNVLTRPYERQGRWQAEYFHNAHPLTLELACGKGEYTLALAQRFPQRNFIGVDAKGDRLWKGAKTALQQGLANAAFVRGLIEEVTRFFAPQEVEEIWIPFPEPRPKRVQAGRRLTAASFLQGYRQILQSGGRVHFKTDDEDLFEFTLATLASEHCTILEVHRNLHQTIAADDARAVLTTYESRYLAAGKTIKYICFCP